MRTAVDGVYFGISPRRGAGEFIQLARQSGADGVNWPYHPDYGMDDAEGMAARLREAELQVISVGLTQHLLATPGWETGVREAFVRVVEAARVLGTRVIDCWPQRAPEVGKEHAQAVLAHNLDVLASLAQEAGCVISMEFEPGITLERFGEAVEFIAPWVPTVRLTADTYHIIRVGDDLVEAGRQLGPHIGVIHFSGSHRREPGSEGDRCDYVGFLSAALQAGYQGDIVLQYASPEDAPESLQRAVALARSVIAACASARA